MSSSQTNKSTDLGERPKERIRLEGVEETLFCTLLPKARDAASPNPILGDPYAQKLVDSCDVDFSRSTFSAVDNERAMRWVANRAKTFDRWCQEFLDKHQGAPVTVLHLACGLDSRVYRVKRRGADVRWIDLDRPLVVDLRRRLIPQDPPGDYSLRTLDVNKSGWLSDIPADRPTLIMAEGLFMYLTPAKVESVICDLVDYFKQGELVLDTVSKIYVRYTSQVELLQASGAKWLWGTDDAKEVEKFHRQLRMIDQVWSTEYMGHKSLGRSLVPLFGEGTIGSIKMALASFSPSTYAFGQNVRFAF
ncbi:uncharacterized protein JN550_010206 [Neoarthrinium moseri]|uniref:uncharacterized protein n=1 Tax=Neoarthrinium moseri TaxID=1658444 RepID=UPI001FDD3C95|nr:uncharacterized protein JN550_010206 [Neoarthrinium moseri]KAI1862344.1 hypothetical protein JN550_010206 [Neoarthrinium moseri]